MSTIMKKNLFVLGLFASSCLFASATINTIGDLAEEGDYDTNYADVAIADYGECGDDGDPVYWAISTDFTTLYITGDGWMEDYYLFDSWSEDEPYRYLTKVPDFMNASKNYASTITSVVVDTYVGLVNPHAFKGLGKLQNFVVDSENPWLCSKDGVIYMKSDNKLCAYPQGREGAFVIPDDVEFLEEGAFYYCDKLTSITFPENATFPVEVDCFMGCSKLTDIVWPKNSIRLNNWAFANCDMLTSVNIGSNQIVGSVTFADCPNLTEYIVDESNSFCVSVDGVLFMKSAVTEGEIHLKEYPAGASRTEYTLPDNCIGIEQLSFYKAKNLETLTLPSSIATIEQQAFMSCTNLKKINCLRETPPSLTHFADQTPSIAFYGLDKEKCVLCVPEGCVDIYKSTAGWKDFKYIEEYEEPVTGINDVNVAKGNATKMIKDGQVIINAGGTLYNTMGQPVK